MPYNEQYDPYRGLPDEPETLGRIGAPVTPSDTVDLVPYAKALVVTAAGNLVILPMMNADGVTITFTGLPVGYVLPYQVRRVYATGTTASVATVGN